MFLEVRASASLTSPAASVDHKRANTMPPLELSLKTLKTLHTVHKDSSSLGTMATIDTGQLRTIMSALVHTLRVIKLGQSRTAVIDCSHLYMTYRIPDAIRFHHAMQ